MSYVPAAEPLLYQMGFLTLNENGAILASGGDLENDEAKAEVLYRIVTMQQKVDTFLDEGCTRLSALFAPVFCGNILSQKVNGALTNADNYLFENDIRELLEKLRGILKNGDPENNIPPLEPLLVPHFDFDFILEDSRIGGYLDQVVVRNLSDFIVTDVAFNVILFKISLGLRFQVLTIEGGYKALGNIFEEILNGEGEFLSNTTTLDVNLMIHLGSNLNRTVIKEFTVDFKFANDDIVFSNKYTGETAAHFDNAFLEPFLYRIRDDYFPLLLNTLTLVGSDLVHDLTLDQILAFILGLIQGNGFDLISLAK